MNARKNPGPSDPRWQRAMKRLGLPHLSTGKGMSCDEWVLDPDDPATFQLVVEAVRQRMSGFQWDLLWARMYAEQPLVDGFYEAVMEAFGED